jgi:hypothetical protein
MSYRTLLSCEQPWVTELYCSVNNHKLPNSIIVWTTTSYWNILSCEQPWVTKLCYRVYNQELPNSIIVWTTMSYRNLLSCEQPRVTEIYYRVNNHELPNSIIVWTTMNYRTLCLLLYSQHGVIELCHRFDTNELLTPVLKTMLKTASYWILRLLLCFTTPSCGTPCLWPCSQ